MISYLLGASIDLRTSLTSLAIWTLASPVMEAESAMLSSISEAITPGATTGSLSSLNMSHLSYIKAGSVEIRSEVIFKKSSNLYYRLDLGVC